MIHSMTGYGKSVLELPTKTIRLELKSLNSKSLDLNMRMPSMYRAKELELRKLIGLQLGRGKVDFSLYVEFNKGEAPAKINVEVVKSYMGQLQGISSAAPLELLKMAVKMPDALTTEREDIDPKEWKLISSELSVVLDRVEEYRKDEGAVLKTDFLKRISNIDALLKTIIDIDPERIEHVRVRLNKGVADLKEKVDQNRFEQELIYYIEKLDITEEKIRLKNHLDYFNKTLKSDDSNGKKLGFISQEIGREINTIGSKANFAPMQKLVVQMKDELEKIKEQLLNVL
ncbi:protein YicC [Formosa sp. Hel3_A1_48]|uniref:YicC/YloC family endoribonuclease n=1 Tax=Formosa sp. Hel3_A1_48 TaxID=1336795 RepID=UPI00084E290D|nr:YicC/YloC family endoribonuclease [Formosa sp. Hel3_A1_48]AOR26277.1 protein YicC [Formosa sp. Hel3_A1_48]MDC0949975.1 YicC family protein [Flavobacteriaceae bacterium]